jgi:hypothetical protein
MNMSRWFAAASVAVVLSAVVSAGLAQSALRAQGNRDEGLAARVQALEAREAIRTLYAEYGRTLDARDFNAFSRLFARNAEYGSAKGPAAIGALLEKAIGTNYPDSKGKNYHLYFNESIDVQGDRATGISKGGYVMATADNTKADFLLLATYRDEYIREDGQWKFNRRQTIGEIPVPRLPAR